MISNSKLGVGTVFIQELIELIAIRGKSKNNIINQITIFIAYLMLTHGEAILQAFDFCVGKLLMNQR